MIYQTSIERHSPTECLSFFYQELENLKIMFDNERHWIDDPLDVVNAKPDFSGLGIEPKHKQKKEL